MKRTALQWIMGVILAGALFAPALYGNSGQARTFFSAMEAYKAGDYAQAVAQLEAIARTGVRNGRLFYNLGNAYLKNQQLGPAILWYERGAHLLPNDPDLQFNLNYARSLTKDASEESATPLIRILFFWKYHLSDRAIILLAIGSNLLFWMLLGAFQLTRRRALARGALAAVLAALIFVLTAGFNYYEARHPSLAIVLPQQVAIRSGLEESSTELFVLHAGAKVKVLKQRRDHYQVRFAADKIGWVEKERIGLIH